MKLHIYAGSDKVAFESQSFSETQLAIAIGTFTLLSRGAQGIKLFRDIAEVTGGLLQTSDYNGTLEIIEGKVTENNALPYFLRYAIVNDGIKPDDIEGLQNSMSRWYDECSPDKKPDYLKGRQTK